MHRPILSDRRVLARDSSLARSARGRVDAHVAAEASPSVPVLDRARSRRPASARHRIGLLNHEKPNSPARREIGWLADAERVDLALYAAIARTPTPTLDLGMARLSRAANYSRLWAGSAVGLAAFGGGSGRRAARLGMTSVAVSSVVTNLALKPLGHRRRPDRVRQQVPVARHVRMPSSDSFPSGHAASAFAFATAVGRVSPRAAVPLRMLAALVGYSRVHTGVHYPGDVAIGALAGTALAELTVHALSSRWHQSVTTSARSRAHARRCRPRVRS